MKVSDQIVRELRFCYMRKDEYLPPQRIGVDDPRLYLLEQARYVIFRLTMNYSENMGKVMFAIR